MLAGTCAVVLYVRGTCAVMRKLALSLVDSQQQMLLTLFLWHETHATS